ncbi:MAG: MarR family transcriptional regulator, partial [Eubacteriales bacterium]|nr:MarR family transcriptional regulator [Eubacteriales bacterium]
EIEVFLEVSHPTVVGIDSRMEQNGYVTSSPSEDGRNKNLKLTSQAEAIGTEMEQRIFAKEQALLAPLSLEDQERLREMLLAIWKNLDGIEAER